MVVISKIDYTSLFESNKVDYCLTLTNYNTKNHNMFISIIIVFYIIILKIVISLS
jgi:hypothetical protein